MSRRAARRLGVPPDRAGELEAVQARHLEVGDRRARTASPSRRAACMTASASGPSSACVTRTSPRAQVGLDDLAVGGVVVDHERAQALGDACCGAPGSRSGPSASSRRTVKWNTLPEPGSELAPTSPPIMRHELAADGEAEPGAAVAARRRGVGLREGLEDAFEACPARSRCRCRRPRSARHRVAARRAARGRRTDTSPSLRELDGVGEQVAEHLAERARGRRGRWPGRRRRARTSSSRPLPCACGESISQVSSIASRRSNSWSSSSSRPGLDLGEVEDVVDDAPAAPRRRTPRSARSRAARTRARCPAAARSCRSRR